MALTEKHLNEYSFADFLREFQESVLEGYRLDLESNERFPQKFGSHLSAILVKPTGEPVSLPQHLVESLERAMQNEDFTSVPDTEVTSEVTSEVTKELPVVKPRKTRE